MLQRQLLKGMAAAAALAGAALGVGAVIQHLNPPQEAVQVGPRKVARGFSHDGDKLPADHPLLVATASTSPLSDTDEVEPPSLPETPPPVGAPSAAAAANTDEGLTLRRHCSWGVPGRNPYTGSVELALRTARVPESVVRRIAEDVAAKRTTDRLSITNGSIRADGSGRRFDPTQLAMTYGRTLCVDTRVNFKKNHVERADLYEAADSKGRMVAVMVPDVCGNVSVLSEVAEADDLQGAEAARQEGRSSGLRRLPPALVYNDAGGAGPGSGAGARLAAGRSASNAVPAPGTLLCTLTALAAALLLTRRRRTR